jgi:hypothetical protein
MSAGDQFYTPEIIAGALTREVRSKNVTIVADFAVGDGSLLRAASVKWPGARYIATDVDGQVLRKIRRLYPTWETGQCDFLSTFSRSHSRVLAELGEKVSVVLLNPPFSCRGNSRWKTLVGRDSVVCSRAMAFVLNAIPYLAADGEILAVLPAGCLRSQKDRCAWEVVRRHCADTVVGVNGRGTFPGCYPRTVITHLIRHRMPQAFLGNTQGNTYPSDGQAGGQVKLYRGKFPVHDIGQDADGWVVPFIHSTDLRGNSVRQSCRKVGAQHGFVCGRAVLIPRVGKPCKTKLAVLSRPRRVVLSDCVFALVCEDDEAAVRLEKRLESNWEKVANCYSGTCAPYITVESLTALLTGMGYHVSTERIPYSDGNGRG